jgi:hypothetical protein
MENLADFRTAAAIVGGLLALVVAGIVVARMLRSRASQAPPPEPAEPAAGASEAAYLDSSHIISGLPAAAAEAAYLDSSHIIAGSTPGAAERTAQGDGGIAAQGDASAKPGSADPGPRQ